LAVLIRLISDYAFVFYALCAVGMLFSIRTALLARHERGLAAFTLEKETASTREARAYFTALFFVLTAGVIFIVASYVAPNIPPPPGEPVVRPPVVAITPSPTPRPPRPTKTPTLTPTPVPPTPEPTATEVPTPPYPPLPPCNPQAHITWPASNTVSPRQPIDIRGTATALADVFNYYKVEVGVGIQPNTWMTIGDIHRYMITDGVLETWHAEGLAPGPYVLQLVVVNQGGNFCTRRARCG
jgi:hypothetical protein